MHDIAMKPRCLAALAVLLGLYAGAPHNARAQARNVTWVGGTGAWEDNNNWADGTLNPLQPFDPDAVFIPNGTPTITFLEGMNTLDVSAGAGIAQNGVLGVHNGVVNDGSITVGPNGQFIIDAGALQGTGVAVLTDSIGTNATILGAPNSNQPCCVTHAAEHTIRGEGTVFGKWINYGLIRAEEASGDASAVLTISGAMTNYGEIRSSASGAIRLESATLTLGAGGQFIADTQSIQLSTATIVGGSIDAINGARLVRVADVGGTTVLSGVTINGDFDVLVNNAGVTGTGTGITNNGTMTIDNSNVANGELSFTGGSTLDGTGQVILNRANDNTHLSGSFTHGANHTIRGVGRIHATIVNEGSIVAETRNGDVLRVVGNSIANDNLLQANNGATLRLEQQVAVTQSANGRIRAADGGRVELRDNPVITGGSLQTEGTGLIVGLNSSTLNGVTNEGAYHVHAGSTTRINTTLTNNGVVTVDPTGSGSVTRIEFSSNTALQGTGTIDLNSTNARITTLAGEKVVTQAAGHTIRGRGVIDTGILGGGGFVNQGRLEGNSAAEPLAIFTRLSGSGTLKDVTIGGGFLQNQHVIGEEGTTAIVAVEGLYGFGRNSSMLVDLAGTTPGTGYDQLNSNGPIALSSTATRLEVSLAGGYAPSGGELFTLVTTTGTLTGNFGTVSLPALPFGLSWQDASTAQSIAYRVQGSISFRPGDIDLDGDVDRADAAAFAPHFGRGVSSVWTTGDFNADGRTDLADLALLQKNFTGQGPSSAAMAVPEPSSAILATGAVLLIVGRKRLPSPFHRKSRAWRSMSRSTLASVI